MAERAWIRDLSPGMQIEESYVVRSRELRPRRGRGNYLALNLGDRSGDVTALAWENCEELARICEPGKVIRIEAQVQRYQGRLQIVIRDARALAPEEVDQGDFVRASAMDPQILWQQLQGLIDGIANAHLKQLLFRIFSDPDVAEAFKTAPAAKSMHHAFRSGLLEHTVSSATAARMLAAHYGANEDLVVAGMLLHDLGKIWELESGNSIEYSDDGRLLGHISMEVLHVDRKIAELSEFPAEIRRQLLHILLSHHGEYSYGSPRRPKTPEAMLVHMADNLDARMAGVFEAIESEGDTGEAWSPYSRMLERNIYRRRLKEEGRGGKS